MEGGDMTGSLLADTLGCGVAGVTDRHQLQFWDKIAVGTQLRLRVSRLCKTLWHGRKFLSSTNCLARCCMNTSASPWQKRGGPLQVQDKLGLQVQVPSTGKRSSPHGRSRASPSSCRQKLALQVRLSHPEQQHLQIKHAQGRKAVKCEQC